MHIVCPHCHNPIEVVKLTPREEITCSACGSSFRLETEATTGSENSAGWTVGRFVLIETVGQGGFGTVYKARDPELDRVVAIKVPRSGNLAGPQELDRFLREARSVAQLRHPSIVSVHEVGQQEGVPYLVSDFVRGVTLADLLSARRPGFREAAELVAVVADALQYAHERGVVHRDVKPSNIMIGEDGRPCVMDFGLARRETGEITMTIEGQVLGTPAYMSPEQARGEGHTADARSDVYSLGVVLYQLLTGELPFRGTKAMVLHQVEHDEPRPPRGLNDHIPRDLETITVKAMAKEPERRYQSARALAEDLRRWLNGEPIQARPVGRAERAVRWAKRRPALAALLMMSGVAALALVGLAVGLYFNAKLDEAFRGEAAAHKTADEARKAEEDQRKAADGARTQAEEAKKDEEEQRKIAEAAVERADQKAYFLSIFLARLALEDDDLLRTRQRLDDCKEKLRGWEWHYLNSQCHPELFSFPGSDAVFSPDSTLIAAISWPAGPGVVGGNASLHVYDVQTGQETLAHKAPVAFVRQVPVFSPDGKLVAVTGRDDVRMYDARTGREETTIKAGDFSHLVFSPDGTRIAVLADTGMKQLDPPLGRAVLGVIRVLDARTGQKELTLKVRGDSQLGDPVFSPDGARIAVRSQEVVYERIDPQTQRARLSDAVIRVYDARSGQEALTLKTPPLIRGDPVFSPDGTRIAVHCTDNMLRVYDARTGQELLALKGGFPDSTAFSRDGARIATRLGGVVRVYDARGGQEVLALKEPTRPGKAVFSRGGTEKPVFSPDGTRIAVPQVEGFEDGMVRVYDARTGHELLALRGPRGLSRPVFSPDGSLLAAQDRGGLVRVYDARVGQEALFLKGPILKYPVLSPDGTRIAALSSRDGLVRVYDLRTGQEALALKGPVSLGPPVWSPDGKRIAVGPPIFEPGDGLLRVYDGQTGQQVLALKGPAPHGTPVFSPDGARIAVGPPARPRPGVRSDGAVRVYDGQTGQEVFALKGPEPLGSPVFSPNGARIAVGLNFRSFDDKVVRVYDAKTGQEVLTLKEAGQGVTPVFSPDGTRIAVGQFASTVGEMVRVYDGQTGREEVTLRAGLLCPVYSPDGTRIAAVGGDERVGPINGDVRVYDARTGQEVLTLEGSMPYAPLTAPAFSPDGKRIAVDGRDNMLRVYDARTGQELLALKGISFGSTAFSRDGARILGEGYLGKGMEAVGGVVIWEAPQRIEAWQALRRERLFAGLLAWHRARADECERAGESYATTFHLARLIEAEPASGAHHFRRGWALSQLAKADEARTEFEAALALKEGMWEVTLGESHAMLGHWQEAAQLYEKAVVQWPTTTADVWRKLALLRLQQGDRDGYRKACATMIERFGKSQNPNDANTAAWICAVGKGSLPELQPAVEAARRAVQALPKAWAVRGTLGAILFRAGQDAEAVKELNESIRLNQAGGTTMDFLFLAMAHHRLGKPDEARTWLEKATQAHAKEPPVFWTDRLEWQLLHREAEALLKEPPPDPKK